MQYLEKIFQIPFTLSPVDQIGYTSMIDALTASTPAAAGFSATGAVPDPSGS